MDVVFITTTSEKLDSVPVIDGQIIALSDVDAYLYDQGGIRRAASQHNVVTTLPSVGIHGSTYIVTEGDVVHPKGIYVWANDNWIDVTRLGNEVVTLTVIPSSWTTGHHVSPYLGTIYTHTGTLVEGKDAYISAVQEGKVIRFNIKWSANGEVETDYLVGSINGFESVLSDTFIYPAGANEEGATGSSTCQLLLSYTAVSQAQNRLVESFGEGLMYHFLVDYDAVNDSLQVAIVINSDSNDIDVFYDRLSSEEVLTSTEDKTIVGGIEELAKKKEIVRLATGDYSATLPDCPEGSWLDGAMAVDITIPEDIDFDFSDDALAKYTPVLDNGTTYVGKTALKTAVELAPVAAEPTLYHTFMRNHPSENRLDTIQIISISGKTCTAVISQEYLLTRDRTYPTLDTADQSIIGAINEAYNREEVKEVRILDEVPGVQEYTNECVVVLDVSAVLEDYFGYTYPWPDGRCIATWGFNVHVPVMHYIGEFAEDVQWEGVGARGMAYPTFAGYMPRTVDPESAFYEDLKEIGGPCFVTLQIIAEITSDETGTLDEEYIDKGYYYGIMRYHTMFLDKHEYDKLNTTNKQIIPAINEVYEKAAAAATSSNSLVIPVTTTATSVEGLTAENMTIDSAFTNAVIVERMTETTEVYLCIQVGSYQIFCQLADLSAYASESQSIDIDGNNMNYLFFQGFVKGDGDARIDIRITITMSPGSTDPNIEYVMVHREDLDLDAFDSNTSNADWNTNTQGAAGFINNRTHYVKYTDSKDVWEKACVNVEYNSRSNFIQSFYSGSGDTDFIEIGKTYRLTLTASIGGNLRTFEMYGKGKVGAGELTGDIVIGMEDEDTLHDRTKYEGMRTFLFFRYSDTRWALTQSVESILSYLYNINSAERHTLKIEEVTEEVVPLDSKYLPETEIKNWAKEVVDSQIVELSQAEYDELTEDEKHNGKIYVITDEVSTETAVVDIIKENVVQISQSDYDVLTPEQKEAKKYIVMPASITQNEVEKIVSDMHVRLTQDEYDALSEEEKNDGKIYMIDDGNGSSSINLDNCEEVLSFGTEEGLTGYVQEVMSSPNYYSNVNLVSGCFSTTGPGTPGTYRIDVQYLVLARDGNEYEDLAIPAVLYLQLCIADNFYAVIPQSVSLIQTGIHANHGSVFQAMGTVTSFISLPDEAFERSWSMKFTSDSKLILSVAETQRDDDTFPYEVTCKVILTRLTDPQSSQVV